MQGNLGSDGVAGPFFVKLVKQRPRARPFGSNNKSVQATLSHSVNWVPIWGPAHVACQAACADADLASPSSSGEHLSPKRSVACSHECSG